jgi:Tuberculosis necrotizing toxin
MSEMGDSGSAVETSSDGYYIGGPELEADIAKTQKLQAGTEVANSGGSSEAAATGGAKTGGDSDSKGSGDGKAGAPQDAAADSTVEASGGSAGGEAVKEPGQGEPAVPPASGGYYIGGPELEADIAKQQRQATGGGDNGNGNGPKRLPEPPTAGRALDQAVEAQDFGTHVQNGLEAHLNNPNTRDQFPDGYDPFHGDTPEQYLDKYASGVDASGKINWNWPDNHDGAVEGTESPTQLQPGEILDRYGSDEGRFLCPSGTSYPERSLPADRLAGEYHQYRVVRPLPAIEAEIGPAFGEPGGGIQFRTDYSVYQLIADGYLEEVTI